MKWTKMQGQTSIPYHPLKTHNNNNNYQAMIPSIIIAPPVQKTLSLVVLI